MAEKYSRGSEWRKWDLHIHSQASDGKLTNEEILELSLSNNIECIAITDHHTFDNVDVIKQLALEKYPSISVITGVEFRTEYGNKSVHMIGLFPDEFNGTILSAKYLHENILCILGLSRSTIIEKGKESDDKKDKNDDYYFHKGWNLVQVDFKNAANLVHQYGGIVTVHAGSKSNSLDEEMKHEGKGPKNVSIYDSLGPVKDELFKNGYIDICEVRNENDSCEFYWRQFHKASITASDTHERDDFGRGYCWIKADCNLQGLRQILEEPERVSFKMPNLLERLNISPTKFIKNITIQKKTDSTIDEEWYGNNTNIDINPGLVAIIGNKGSGKSAITDIMSICANTHKTEFSFLSTNKFRNPKPYNRAKSFEAKITWGDDSSTDFISLENNGDVNQPERVKYIPQNYLENLCTIEDDNQFEEEIKSIIFQHLSEEEKYGKESLDDVINYLSSETKSAEDGFVATIGNQNEKIIALEEKKRPEYAEKLRNALSLKKEELKNLQKVKPAEVLKPEHSDSEEDREKQMEIDELKTKLEDLKKQIEAEQNNIKSVKKHIVDLNNAKERLERLTNVMQSTINELDSVFSELGLSINDIVKFSIDKQAIDDKAEQLKTEEKQIIDLLDEKNANSLVTTKKATESSINEAEQRLSEPDRLYHKYQVELNEWQSKIDAIVGKEDVVDTIKYYETQLDYISNTLDADLQTECDNRKRTILLLLEKKRDELCKRSLLYQPVVDFISKYNDVLKDYPISLDSVFIFDGTEKLFDIINQQSSGTFCGKENGMLKLREMKSAIDLTDNDSIYNFALSINNALKADLRENGSHAEKDIKNQLKKDYTIKNLYDFMYGFEYIRPLFELKLDDKKLSILSPGERGALLLLFYLFIDMDDKPLIIDQPEENLDNESVYKYLVKFIKMAKEKRQVIMVTHNPNLAVVCDAEQIIKMEIDKKNKNTVSFISGSIENPDVNKCIVDILEGTYPAFHNRDQKYINKA